MNIKDVKEFALSTGVFALLLGLLIGLGIEHEFGLLQSNEVEVDAEQTAELLFDVQQYEEEFKQAGEEFEIDPYLLMSIAVQESGGRHYNQNGTVVSPQATSHLGLMQVSYNQNHNILADYGIEEEDLVNPLDNIRAGAAILSHLYEMTDELPSAIFAYHAGQAFIHFTNTHNLEYSEETVERYEDEFASFPVDKDYVRSVTDNRLALIISQTLTPEDIEKLRTLDEENPGSLEELFNDIFNQNQE